MNELAVIENEYNSVIGYLEKLMGPGGGPLVIQDEKQRTSTLENIVQLTSIEKAIAAHFDPEIKPLYDAWKAKTTEKATWIDIVADAKRSANMAVKNFNDLERAKQDEIRRIEAEKEAQKQREALELVKTQAIIAGNDETIKEIEAQQREIIVNPFYIPTTQIKAHSEAVTMSETAIIEEFQIIDQLVAIQACIDAGIGNLLELSTKAETAIKKHLVSNPGIKAMPGMYIKRGFKVNTRKK